MLGVIGQVPASTGGVTRPSWRFFGGRKTSSFIVTPPEEAGSCDVGSGCEAEGPGLETDADSAATAAFEEASNGVADEDCGVGGRSCGTEAFPRGVGLTGTCTRATSGDSGGGDG